MFHHLHDGGRHLRGQGSISAEEFRQIIQYIGPERIITPYEWLGRLSSHQLKNEDICLTFDDSLLCQFEVALPVMEEYGIQAFWFIYSSVFEGFRSKFEMYRRFRCSYFDEINEFYELFFEKVDKSPFSDKALTLINERSLNKVISAAPFYSTEDAKFRIIRDQVLTPRSFEGFMDQIIQDYGIEEEDLGRHMWMTNENLLELRHLGHVIGLHSYSHPMVMATLPYQDQWNEYRRNLHHIQKVCESEVLSMAHPADSYNHETLEILRKLGIICGFRANNCFTPQSSDYESNNLELNREDHANILQMITSGSQKGGM